MLINRKDVRKWQVFKSENNTIAEMDEVVSKIAEVLSEGVGVIA